jgi:hypothetical protein
MIFIVFIALSHTLNRSRVSDQASLRKYSSSENADWRQGVAAGEPAEEIMTPKQYERRQRIGFNAIAGAEF